MHNIVEYCWTCYTTEMNTLKLLIIVYVFIGGILILKCIHGVLYKSLNLLKKAVTFSSYNVGSGALLWFQHFITKCCKYDML